MQKNSVKFEPKFSKDNVEKLRLSEAKSDLSF